MKPDPIKTQYWLNEIKANRNNHWRLDWCHLGLKLHLNDKPKKPKQEIKHQLTLRPLP